MSDLEKLRNDISPSLSALDDPEEDPGKTFRALYDDWVARGPFPKGKPFHSVRMMKAWLLQKKMSVRSLETKLAGQTRLPRQDAIHLVTLFLENWRYEEGSETGHPFSDENSGELAVRIVNEIYPQGTETLLLPLRARSQQNGKIISEGASNPSIDIKASRNVILDLFAESDALITISRDQTLITENPAESMRLFRTLMQELCDIDKEDGRRRALIWVVDFGLRDGRESSVGTFLNILSLASQFRAIAIFDVAGQMKLWRELSKRVVVVVGSLHRFEIDRIYRQAKIELPEATPDIPSVVGDRIFLEAIPRRWFEAGLYAKEFGLDYGSFWQHPTITAHLSLDDWELDHDKEIDRRKDLRYFYHAALSRGRGAHCIELQQPGLRWSDGFRTACDAAFWRLGIEHKQINKEVMPTAPIALLRRHGFVVTTLNEFVRLTNNLIEANLEQVEEPSDRKAS